MISLIKPIISSFTKAHFTSISQKMGLIPTFLVAYKIAKELEWEYKQIFQFPSQSLMKKFPQPKREKDDYSIFHPQLNNSYFHFYLICFLG